LRPDLARRLAVLPDQLFAVGRDNAGDGGILADHWAFRKDPSNMRQVDAQIDVDAKHRFIIAYRKLGPNPHPLGDVPRSAHPRDLVSQLQRWAGAVWFSGPEDGAKLQLLSERRLNASWVVIEFLNPQPQDHTPQRMRLMVDSRNGTVVQAYAWPVLSN